MNNAVQSRLNNGDVIKNILITLLYCFFTVIPYVFTVYFSTSFDLAVETMLCSHLGLSFFIITKSSKKIPGIDFSSGEIKRSALMLLVFLIISLTLSKIIYNLSGSVDYHEHPLNLTVILVLIVIAPFYEEVFFRGFLFGFLKSRFQFSTVTCCLLTTILFCLLHFEDYFTFKMLDIFVSGLILCSLKEKTGSLLYPFLLHSAMNLYSIT